MKIVVASENPVKIKTTELGFERMFGHKDFEISGQSVPSGVSDQPMSDEETLRGAINRVKNLIKKESNADYYVGIEGGVEDTANGMECFAWIVVIDRDGKIGKGRTGTFILPNKVRELILAGDELGTADDKVYGLKNSKQQNGAVGILTGDVLTRTSFYEPAIILALIPFKNPSLY